MLHLRHTFTGVFDVAIIFYNLSCSAVQRKYGVRISRWLLLMLIPSCGMFISSTAYLPSSFTMYCTMVAIAAWFDGSFKVSIVKCK